MLMRSSTDDERRSGECPLLISTSAIDCLGRFVSEMTYYVSSGTLNLTKPKLIYIYCLSMITRSPAQTRDDNESNPK